MKNTRKKYGAFACFTFKTKLVISLIVMLLLNSYGCGGNQNKSMEPGPKSYKLMAPETKGSKSKPDNVQDILGNRFYGKIRKKYQIKDAILSALTSEPPQSGWVNSDKAFYGGLLAGQTYDALVVPFQTSDHGIDMVGRMLMTYRLAVAIESRSSIKIAPLPIVYPALGHNARYYDEDEVLKLAQILGVKRIIWGFAGTRTYPDNNPILFFDSRPKRPANTG